MPIPGQRTVIAGLALTLAAVALRLPVVVSGDPTGILTHHGSDDLFYYTAMAQHLIEDGRPGIDGIHPTSGVQPGFLMLLVPAASLWGNNPEAMLRAVLTLTTILTLVAGWLTWRLVRRVAATSPTAAWIASAIVILHPRILGMTFEGTEGSLALVAWLATLATWHREPDGWRGAMLLGCVVGIGVFIRLDHALLGILVLLRTASGHWRPTRMFVTATTMAGVVMAPWALTCWAWTGTPAPDSGAAKALHASWMVADAGGGLQGSTAVAAAAVRQAAGTLVGAGGEPSRVMLLVLTALSVVILADRAKADAWPTLRAVVNQLWPLLVGSILVVGFASIVLGAVRSWYLAPAFLGLAIGLGAALQDLASRSRRPVVATAAMLAILIGGLWVEAIARPRRPWNAGFVEAAKRLEDYAEPGDRSGAFNAGILAAFSGPGITVSNLDGVANHAALQALRRRSLAAFVDDQGIKWLIDHQGSVRWYLRHAGPDLLPRLERVDIIESANRPDAVIGIWRIRPGPGHRSATLGR